MRPGTITAWLVIGWGLTGIGVIGIFLAAAGLTDGKLPVFLAAVGFVYFIIGGVSAIAHDRHMAKRTRAREE